MKKFVFYGLFAVLLPFQSLAQEGEYEEEVDMMDYDAIVKELSSGPAGSSRGRSSSGNSDPFASILMHGGVGMAATVSSFQHQGQRIHMDQRGFQAALGIDLFSDHWMAEGAARSFGGRDYSRTSVALKEFDLKVYYRNRLTSNVGLRIGGGLAARYLSVTSLAGAYSYSTPSSIMAMGLEYFVSPAVSVGAELSARNSLIDDTIDRSAFDATFRVDTHF